MECYKDIDDIRDTFEIFANQTEKLVVANGDNAEVRKIHYHNKVLFYDNGEPIIITQDFKIAYSKNIKQAYIFNYFLFLYI